MQVAHAIGQSLLQGGIFDFVQEWSEVFLSAVQEPTERPTFILWTDLSAASAPVTEASVGCEGYVLLLCEVCRDLI